MSRIIITSSAPVSLFDPANLSRWTTEDQHHSNCRRMHPPHDHPRRPAIPPPVKNWEERWIIGLYGILYPVEMYLGRARPDGEACYNAQADMWVGFRMGRPRADPAA